MSYGRFSDDEQIIVIINNQEYERDVRVTAWKTGVSRKDATAFERLILFIKGWLHRGRRGIYG